jgi:chemotaxis signal transduction protein
LTGSANPVSALEKVRELEGEIAELRRGLGDIVETTAGRATFHALEITIGELTYLIPIDQVREVVPMAWPEPITGAPNWVMGTVSYGGIPTTLIDLGLRTTGEPTGLTRNLLMVIVEGDRWLGLVVAAAGDIHEVAAAEVITPGPDIACASFLIGLTQLGDGRSLSVLSLTRVGRDLDA